MPTTPPLDAEYDAWPIWPSNAATLARLTIAPRWPSASGSLRLITVAAWRTTSKVPIRLIAITLLERVEVVGRLDLAVAADRALGPADAGRVDHRAQRRDLGGGVDGGGDLVGVGDVDRGEDAADLGGERLALVGLQVGDDDDGTLAASRRATAAPMPRRRR